MKRVAALILLLVGCKGAPQQAQVVETDGVHPRGVKLEVRTLPFYDRSDVYALSDGQIAKNAVVVLPLEGGPAFIRRDNTTTSPFGKDDRTRTYKMGETIKVIQGPWLEDDVYAVIDNGEIVGTIALADISKTALDKDSYLQSVEDALVDGKDNQQLGEILKRALASAPSEEMLVKLSERFALYAPGKSAPKVELEPFWTSPKAPGIAYVARPDLAVGEKLALWQPVQLSAIKGDKADISFGVSGSVDLDWATASVKERHVAVKRGTVALAALSTEPYSIPELKAHESLVAHAYAYLLSANGDVRRDLVREAFAQKRFGLLIDLRAWEAESLYGTVNDASEFDSPAVGFDDSPFLFYGCKGKREKAKLVRCNPETSCSTGANGCIEFDPTSVCVPFAASTEQDVCTNAACRESVRQARKEIAEHAKAARQEKARFDRFIAKASKLVSGPHYFRFTGMRLLYEAPELQASKSEPASEPASQPAGMPLFIYRLRTYMGASGPCEASRYREIDKAEIIAAMIAPTDLGREVSFWIDVPETADNEYGAILAPSEAAVRDWLKTRKAEEYGEQSVERPSHVVAPYPLTMVHPYINPDCSSACE